MKLLKILMVIVLLLYGCQAERSIDKQPIRIVDIGEYMDINRYPFSLDSGKMVGLEILEEDLKSSSIVLAGEFHGVEANYQLKMALIGFLKEKINFKYLLSEISHSGAYYLNQYLKTGDESILDSIKDSLFTCQEDYNFWRKLYIFNKSLEEGDRILVVGVDLESDLRRDLTYLKEMINDTTGPQPQMALSLIEEGIDLLDQSFQKKYKVVEICKRILEDITLHREVYEECLQNDLVYWEMVVENIIKLDEASSLSSKPVERSNMRDRIIYENFLTLDRVLPEGKYFGQWGIGHVLQRKLSDGVWFASYLDDDQSKYKDKVLSLVFNYMNCEVDNRQVDSDLNYIFDFVDEDLEVYDNDYTLYKLNSRQIKRPEIRILNTLSHEVLESDVADYFQYILLIKNAKATKPLK